MNQQHNCKACSASVHVAADKIYDSIKRTLLEDSGCMPLEIFRSRIDICSSCSSLAYGTTCLHCGCLIHARALHKDSYCPCPDGRKW